MDFRRNQSRDERRRLSPAHAGERWAFIAEHCRLEVARRGDERRAIHGMRARLMAYSRGLPHGRHLREQFARVESVAQIEDIAATHLREAPETPV